MTKSTQAPKARSNATPALPPPRVLCAAVPFGTNNVGDEAIIAGMVRLIRSVCPNAEITVATSDPETTQRDLQVKTCKPFGFDGVPTTGPEVNEVISQHDILIWSGATGLSDYPDIPLTLFRTARRLGKHTAIMCVGMSLELNPHLYTVRSRWRPTYDKIRKGTGGAIDLAGSIEKYRKSRTFRSFRTVLPKTDLIFVRDADTKSQLEDVGVEANIQVGADAALMLRPTPFDKIPLSESVRKALTGTGSPRIGLCMSAQDAPKNLPGIVAMIDRVMADTKATLYGIPINVVTDAKLMATIKTPSQPQGIILVDGVSKPEDVAGVLGRMDVIISSRLHGLILASLSDVPLVGIRRGTKIDSYLRPYGLAPAGTFTEPDLGEMENQLRQHLAKPAEFREKAAKVREAGQGRLKKAAQELGALLEKISASKARQ